MGRKRNRVIPKPVLFIACEGTSTEFQYFESWGQSEHVLKHFERVDVYPKKRDVAPKTTPFELLQIAKSILEDRTANIAWIVFDKDNHPKLAETFSEAREFGVKVAFSSRSIEQWVLLHFEKKCTAFLASECKEINDKDKPLQCGTRESYDCLPIACLSGHIRREDFIRDYSKKKSFDLYSKLLSRTEIAMVNVAWQRFKMNASIDQIYPVDLHNLNPYSNVDSLILELQGREDKIEWGGAGQNIELNNWVISAIKTKDNIIVQLSHLNHQAIILNNDFPSSSFYTTDEELNNLRCIVQSSRFIKNYNHSQNNILYANDIMEYILELHQNPYFLFYDKVKKTRIYVEFS
jgi:hypothetical protein